MKYLKTIYESINERDKMILATYKNAITNNNISVIKDVNAKYGIDNDMLSELIFYCIFELKDLDKLKILLEEFLYNPMLKYKEIINIIYTRDVYNWQVRSFKTGKQLALIVKLKNRASITFFGEDDDDDDDGEDNANMVSIIQRKIKTELDIVLNTTKSNDLTTEQCIKILLLLLKMEENDKLISIQQLMYSIEDTIDKIKDRIKNKINDII